MEKRFTPERIDTLEANEVFVFGSNLQGMHGGGAARVAYSKFGAIWGNGVGLQGQSYAIPTMHGGVDVIAPYVEEFIAFARQHRELVFLVTRIGCGIAGFTDEEMAPLFKDTFNDDNIILPKSFYDIIISQKEQVRPLILISNDDGVNARGLYHLIDCVKDLGDVVAVAPAGHCSGQSSAITVDKILRVKQHEDYCGAKIYSVTGTPVDCVKMAMHTILDRKPDLMLSGINHGSNAGNSIIYSGTMGAAMEACMMGVTSIGYSFLSYLEDADFSPSTPYIKEITSRVLAQGLPQDTCLNINIPASDIQGIKIARAARGYWTDEYAEYTDPIGRKFYLLTGHFHNDEPDCDETDLYWLERKYVTIVPAHTDMTAHDAMPLLTEMLQ